MKSWRALTNRIDQGIGQCLKGFWLKLILPCIHAVTKFLSRLWRRIARDKQFAIVFFITSGLILFSVLFGIVPTTQNFEGNLLVRSLSFTCNEPDRLLLKDVRNLKDISISGIQKFTLAGTFGSKSHPELNKLDKLEIELPEENSFWQISTTADFSLEELRLQEGTRIRNLKYSPFNRRLSFTLQPSSNSSPAPVFLFDPGPNPLKITLSGYRLVNFPITSGNTPLEFDLRTTRFQLQPTNPIDVNLQLPPDDGQPFWGNINVTNVRFEQLIQAGNNTNDDILDSTIVSGNIRMAKQELKLEENQFLIVEKPGIETLSRIKIVQPDASQKIELKTSGDGIKISEPPKGLEVTISGSTNGIKAGLNPRLAIAQIQGSFLSRYVSNDVIVAIISFSAGLIVSLLSWLFNNFPEPPAKS